VALDRLHRDEKLPRDLPVGVTAGNEPQDLPFPGGQLIELGIEGRPGGIDGRPAGEGVQDEARQPGREDRVAGRDPVHGGHQVGTRDRLGDVTPRARPDDGNDILGRILGRQRQETHLRMGRLRRRDHVLAAPAGQVNIEQNDIRENAGDQVDRRPDVARLTDDLDLVAELGTHSGTEQAVVIDDNDRRPVTAGSPCARGPRVWSAHARLGWRSPAARGIVRDTSVPSP